MYFATLTEIPILQGLIGNGMGNGPALAFLLAGPALSLPNMLVIRSVLGTKKTIVFVLFPRDGSRLSFTNCQPWDRFHPLLTPITSSKPSKLIPSAL